MMLTQGLFTLVNDIGGDMVNGEAGTSEVEFDSSQTGVITAIGATDIALNDITISAESINSTYILDISTANSEDLVEYEVNDGGGVAYNRCLKAVISKVSTIEFNLLHSFEFQIVI